jgi:hypothetical protein
MFIYVGLNRPNERNFFQTQFFFKKKLIKILRSIDEIFHENTCINAAL